MAPARINAKERSVHPADAPKKIEIAHTQPGRLLAATSVFMSFLPANAAACACRNRRLGEQCAHSSSASLSSKSRASLCSEKTSKKTWGIVEFVLLKGQSLAQANFLIGQNINVEVRENQLIPTTQPS